MGGAALDGDLARRGREAGWPLAVTYGMSETASQLATLPEVGADWQPGLAGKPLDGFEVAIGSDGRIRVRGPAVMVGYANPEGREGVGLEDGGWFPTGDLGRLDAEGNLRVLGRADEALTTGGETFHPQEVERRLAACPGVREAAIAGRPDPVWGDLVTALVVGEVSEDVVLGWCREHIDGAKRPRLVRLLPALPRTALGKLDRAALRKIASA
ncbi:MAG: AMP-binding protein [Magnetospirillum sp. WYHS-4]